MFDVTLKGGPLDGHSVVLTAFQAILLFEIQPKPNVAVFHEHTPPEDGTRQYIYDFETIHSYRYRG